MATKFSASMYVTTFLLAREGLTDEQIGKTLGVAGRTFRGWLKQKPHLAEAADRGRRKTKPGKEKTFHEYIYDHLSPHLRKVWDEINECEDLENGVERVEALLKNQGKRTRQHLFLYAFTQSVFNISAALRKLAIPRKTYESWCANDPDFTELMDEMHWHKENFFENALIGRVQVGDTPAILHAVKTQCRSRGYNDKQEIIHSGTITNAHTVNIVDLDLDIETRQKILVALRKKQADDEAVGDVTDGRNL